MNDATNDIALTNDDLRRIAREVGMLASHDGVYMRSVGTHGGMSAEDGFAFARAAILADRARAAAVQAAPADAGEQAEPKGWREALQFYADQLHFTIADESAWDTVSGEPQNFWCDEEGTATVEDGTVAKMALAGTPLPNEDDALADQLATEKAEPVGEIVGVVKQGFELVTVVKWRPGFNRTKVGTKLYDRPAAQVAREPLTEYQVCEIYAGRMDQSGNPLVAAALNAAPGAEGEQS